MCCLRWSRLEIWFFHVLLVSDSLLLGVSVSPEEYRNNGLYCEMFERLGTGCIHFTLRGSAMKQVSAFLYNAWFSVLEAFGQIPYFLRERKMTSEPVSYSAMCLFQLRTHVLASVYGGVWKISH